MVDRDVLVFSNVIDYVHADVFPICVIVAALVALSNLDRYKKRRVRSFPLLITGLHQGFTQLLRKFLRTVT